MSRLWSIGSGPTLALVLVLAALAGDGVLVLGVALVQAGVVAGWHRSMSVPGAVQGMVLAAATAGSADIAVLLAPGDRPLSRLPAVLAVAMVGALGGQLVRRAGRPRLVASLTATVCLLVVAVLPAAQVAALSSRGGAPLVAAAVVPAGLVAAVDALGRAGTGPRWARPVVATLASVGAGAVLAAVTDLSLPAAVGTAAASGAVAWAGAVLADRAPRPDALLATTVPQALAAPVGYVLGRLLVG